MDIRDTNAVNRAAEIRHRSMNGLPPLKTCTSCLQDQDGTTALCESCDQNLADARDEEPDDEFESHDTM